MGNMYGQLGFYTHASDDSGTLTPTEADLLYLRLDTSNDPLVNPLHIQRTANDAGTSPVLELYQRRGASTAGQILDLTRQDFYGNNDAGVKTLQAHQGGFFQEVTEGAEEGGLIWFLNYHGADKLRGYFTSDGATFLGNDNAVSGFVVNNSSGSGKSGLKIIKSRNYNPLTGTGEAGQNGDQLRIDFQHGDADSNISSAGDISNVLVDATSINITTRTDFHVYNASLEYLSFSAFYDGLEIGDADDTNKRLVFKGITGDGSFVWNDFEQYLSFDGNIIVDATKSVNVSGGLPADHPPTPEVNKFYAATAATSAAALIGNYDTDAVKEGYRSMVQLYADDSGEVFLNFAQSVDTPTTPLTAQGFTIISDQGAINGIDPASGSRRIFHVEHFSDANNYAYLDTDTLSGGAIVTEYVLRHGYPIIGANDDYQDLVFSFYNDVAAPNTEKVQYARQRVNQLIATDGGEIGNITWSVVENSLLVDVLKLSAGSAAVIGDVLFQGAAEQWRAGTYDIGNISLVFTPETSGVAANTGWFTFDGDGTDDNYQFIYGLGTLGSTTNIEYLLYGYESGTQEFLMSSEADGSGTTRPLTIGVDYSTANTTFQTFDPTEGYILATTMDTVHTFAKLYNDDGSSPMSIFYKARGSGAFSQIGDQVQVALFTNNAAGNPEQMAVISSTLINNAANAMTTLLNFSVSFNGVSTDVMELQNGELRSAADTDIVSAKNVFSRSGDVVALDNNALAGESLNETDFTTTTKWTAAGDFAFAGGKAVYTHNTGSGTITQAVGDMAIAGIGGSWYKFTYTISGASGDATAFVTISFAESTVNIGSLNGTGAVYFKSAVTPSDFVISVTSLSGGLSLDEVSLKRITAGDLEAAGHLVLGETATPATDPGWTSSSTVDMTAPDTYLKIVHNGVTYAIPAWAIA